MQASKLRFSAGHLFYFASLCAASTGLFGVWGLPVACFVALIWWQVLVGICRETEPVNRDLATIEAQRQPDMWEAHGRPQHRAGVSKIEGLIGLMIVAMLLGLLMPANNESDPLQHAATSMKMIAKAVHAYEQHYGALPPCVVTDERGNALHSWRALILPFLGEDKLAAAYRWDEPWNGPNNVLLAQYRPWHYRVYYPQSEAPRCVTSVQAFGDDVHGFLVVEHESAIGNWLEPSSPVQWSDFAGVPSTEQGFWDRGFFASDYRGRLAVSHDRIYQVHPSAIDNASLSTAANPTSEHLQLGKPYRQWHLVNALRLGIFLLFALYPFRWLKQMQHTTKVHAG